MDFARGLKGFRVLSGERSTHHSAYAILRGLKFATFWTAGRQTLAVAQEHARFSRWPGRQYPALPAPAHAVALGWPRSRRVNTS